ncbi:MAG: hypothetical protein II998_04395 [Clostridia bacterium]|nr:hypothetical protein [Clostridia bacterium]
MNKCFDILPTPRYMSYRDGEMLKVKSVCIAGRKSKIIESALSLFNREVLLREENCEIADVLVFDTAAQNEYISEDDLKIFDEKFADTQGYILKKEKGKPVVICAKTDIGCAYGLMTLLQLVGKPTQEFCIYDRPDFWGRGIKWLIWAECGIWAYDFGDGGENYKKRIVRKLDNCLKYKINLVNADGFGFSTERFPEYADIMRFICDEARNRGIHISVGGYSSGYGMAGHSNTYQGKVFKNRKSYPDGEIYKCLGTYDPHPFLPNGKVDRSIHLTEVRSRDWGTCLSNDALFEEKMKELENYVRKTHIGCISFHNMDSHEIHKEFWLARCDDCRKKWPSDDLFAKDGCAGAFAEFISKLIRRLHSIKDGDYDAQRDLWLRMASPGYLYAGDFTEDPEFDTGVEFWGKVGEYLTENKNFAVGFREQFFYHDKPVLRAQKINECITNTMTSVGYFNGCDGFYDDKLFSANSALNYVMKGYSTLLTENGNSFQEPLQLYNAEYMWNCDNSAFYNVSPRPSDYDEFMQIFNGMLDSSYRPTRVYGDGGMIDVICTKLYGDKYGKKLAEIWKLCGENGEPPIACASNVDIYTNFSKVIYPMRWDIEEITSEEIDEKCVRFEQCFLMTQKAYEIISSVVSEYDGDKDTKADLEWLSGCFDVCRKLCGLLSQYMSIYKKLQTSFDTGDWKNESLIISELEAIKPKIKDYLSFVDVKKGSPIDLFGGASVRQIEIGEHLDYWTDIMMSSVKSKKRIPDDVRPLATRNWW